MKLKEGEFYKNKSSDMIVKIRDINSYRVSYKIIKYKRNKDLEGEIYNLGIISFKVDYCFYQINLKVRRL